MFHQFHYASILKLTFHARSHQYLSLKLLALSRPIFSLLCFTHQGLLVIFLCALCLDYQMLLSLLNLFKYPSLPRIILIYFQR